MPCRHLLLVLDCCFAGAFRWSSTRDLGGLPEVIHREHFARYVRDPAWQVLTSAAHDQKALDVLTGETIGNVANTPGTLPLLSFTLSELYRRYLERGGDDRALSEEDYERLGSVGGSLRNRADEVYRDLPDAAYRETMRRVMLRMVSVEGGELARRRVPDEELVYEDPGENECVQEALRRLTDARLVVEGKEVDEQPFVEPAHDKLIRGWDRLLQWSRDETEGLHLRRRLTPASVAWSRRHGGLWLVEPRLGVLKQVLRSPGNWLNRVETRFVRRSLAVRRRVAIGSAAAIALAFLIISALGLFANDQRHQAVQALDETRHSLARSLLSPIVRSSLTPDWRAVVVFRKNLAGLPRAQLDAMRAELVRLLPESSSDAQCAYQRDQLVGLMLLALEQRLNPSGPVAETGTGAPTTRLEKAHNFCLAVLKDRSFELDRLQCINLLKCPLCVGEIERAVLARLAEQFRPPPAERFEDVWDLVLMDRVPRSAARRVPSAGTPGTGATWRAGWEGHRGAFGFSLS